MLSKLLNKLVDVQLDVADFTVNVISSLYVRKCISTFYTYCCKPEESLSIHFRTWRCSVVGGHF